LWLTLRRRALEESLPVYLVGGPVRDVLLGAPIKDLDFVLEGDAPALARVLADELSGDVITHTSFGTATVVLGDSRVDIVTARQESYPHPGALPPVFAGAIADDLSRRDFSINALALPFFEERPGLIDWHGGLEDLASGVVRILHPRSFIDDPTRILRAVRYEQRFDFRIESETEAWLRDALSGGYLGAVSGDRLRHELERILEEKDPLPALARAAELGVLAAMHPSLKKKDDLRGLQALPLPSGGRYPQVNPMTHLAALVYHLSPAEGEGVISRLNLPNSWARVVRDTIELRRREAELSADPLSGSQIYYLLEGLSEEAVLSVLHLTESGLVGQRLEQFLNQLSGVRPVLNGQDLLEMGVPAGPQVGRLLKRLQQARLDQKVKTEKDERRLVQEILGGEGGNDR
jgi:tRNA nucleotidyltransferase (CCA-adding enzyme)